MSNLSGSAFVCLLTFHLNTCIYMVFWLAPNSLISFFWSLLLFVRDIQHDSFRYVSILCGLHYALLTMIVPISCIITKLISNIGVCLRISLATDFVNKAFRSLSPKESSIKVHPRWDIGWS
ncbi:hypothetical protein BDV29DRAFT_130821 [Aspergillus leporis]|uniref:Uncharacterized protein n=1 Tax=Aspergillus leporis TaxID=41062 RepID=A0A5N5WZD4_9EURO|nr:hypothetical protein BDV29DRAFT_130821 [Aspergillus leporis]